MDQLIYQAVNSAQSSLNRQTLTSSNLAHTGELGFRANIFQAATMYKNGDKPHDHSFVVEDNPTTDFTPGDLIVTGRPLDLAIDGRGWFAVTGPNGQEGYTRAGNFEVDVNGMLTSNKMPVLGDGGPISLPPFQRIVVGTDGTISIVPLDGKPDELAVLDRIKIVDAKNADMEKGEDGLMHMKSGGQAVADASLRVISGSLEGSNVNPINEMANLIEAGRDFETHMKFIQDITDRQKRLAQLMHLD